MSCLLALHCYHAPEDRESLTSRRGIQNVELVIFGGNTRRCPLALASDAPKVAGTADARPTPTISPPLHLYLH